MQDFDFSYQMPEFKSLLVEELDPKIIPLYKEYQNAVMMNELEAMVFFDFDSNEITKHRQNRKRMHYRTSTWQYEIGFLGYIMGKGKSSDVMLGNVMAIQTLRSKEFTNQKNNYLDNPIDLFLEGFRLAHPRKDYDKSIKRCLTSLVDYGMSQDTLMKHLNINIV
jgi:hypothetical protein